MKPHLPYYLYRALMATCLSALSLAFCSGSASAAVMHGGVGIRVYTDFGQNCGRYTANANALLSYIRQQEGGVAITYNNGNASVLLPHGMIDFASAIDSGPAAAVGYNFISTVRHNGTIDSTFSGNMIGSGNAIHYASIEYRSSENSNFLLTPEGWFDIKLSRQSKLITDVSGSAIYSDTDTLDRQGLAGEYQYRVGSGIMKTWDNRGAANYLCYGYTYSIGGVVTTSSQTGYEADGSSYSIGLGLPASGGNAKVDEMLNEKYPLPTMPLAGDSGSPVWVWNDKAGEFQYVGAACASNGVSYTRITASSAWAAETMASFNKTVDMSAVDGNTVFLNSVTRAGESISDSQNGVSTTLYSGTVTTAEGTELCSFVGVKNGLNTWNDLSSLKDKDNWYAYDKSYLNATPASSSAAMTYADLFKTENLVFKAAASSTEIKLNGDIDLGIGYVELDKGSLQHADFTISSAEGGSYMLNSAGYVMGEGTSLHLQLSNPEGYMREWRKIGAGDLYVEGSGNNNILLNLGGSGTTYLNREGGYAAYNVLANNGSRVVLSNAQQIARDLTFGYGGGTLDFNGLESMEWNNAADNASKADAFGIHSLDERGTLANLKAGSSTTLYYTQSGAQTFLGAFADNGADSVLRVVYDGGSGSKWNLNTVSTSLRSEGSGLTVASGTVELAARNTTHALGSLNGTNNQRWSNAQDWHYSDMAADVEVQKDAAFILGSHSRLTGDVTVREGGSFVMREGTQQRYEYVEGGYTKEDTELYKDFYGLKGNVTLEKGGSMQISFSKGTQSRLEYGGKISGEGSLDIRLSGSQSSLRLSGDNSGLTGEKSLACGFLLAADRKALGDVSTNAWKLVEDAFLACEDFDAATSSETILSYIDASSTGTLALTADRTEQLVQDNLFIGALSGHTVEYGTADQSLAADSLGNWNLGGGGGKLVVNYLLTGNNNLNIGNEYYTGSVYLANGNNDFTGTVKLNGHVTLEFADGALGQSKLHLDYGNAAFSDSDPQNFVDSILTADSQGTALIDRAVEKSSADSLFRFTGKDVVLGLSADSTGTYLGRMEAAENAAYRFGGSGRLIVAQALGANGKNDLIVDGRNYSGGVLALAKAASLTGDVTVMAYDETQSSSTEGSMRLLLDEDNALAQAASVTVKNKGILDIGDTKQQFNNLSVGTGAAVVGSGTLTIDVGSSKVVDPIYGEYDKPNELALNGSLNVGTIEKTGVGYLYLSSPSEYGRLNINEGYVYLKGNNALSESGWTVIGDKGALRTGACSTGGNILLQSTVEASGPYIYFGEYGQQGESEFYGNIQATGKLSRMKAYSTAALYGALEVEQGATLNLLSGTFKLMNSNVNVSGGTIRTSAALNFEYMGDDSCQSIDGELVVEKKNLYFRHYNSQYSNAGVEINKLNILSGASLNLSQSTDPQNAGYAKNSIWNIHSLNGVGDLNWSSTSNHSYSSRLILDGEGDYSGTLKLSADKGSGNAYQSFVELAHDKALQNGTLNLQGSGSNAVASLAVNTAAAQLAGLNGNANSYVYAGAAVAASSNSGAASMRESSLVFTGSGSYSYAGKIGNSADKSAGISLVMQGSGTQSLSGSNTLRHVSALAGTLNLGSGSSLTGDVTIAGGATLSKGNALSMGSGRSLILAAGSSSSAVFKGDIVMSGATMQFDGNLLADLQAGGTAALTMGSGSFSVASGSELVLDFVNTGRLSAGSYKLIGGADCSALNTAGFQVSGLGYMLSSFTADSSGLSMTLSVSADSCIWDGTAEKGLWSDSAFGTQSSVPSSDKQVVFNADAANKDVRISGAQQVASLYFDNDEDYSLSVENGGSLSASALEKSGSGAARLNSGVKIAGNALIHSGELVVASSASLTGTASGAGTLGVDFGTGSGSLKVASDLGCLHIISGTYKGSSRDSSLPATLVTVDRGAQLDLSYGSYAEGLEFRIAGSGVGGAALNMSAGIEMKSLISLSDDATMANGSGDSILYHIHTNGHTLTKTGVGRVFMRGADLEGKFNIRSGTLFLEGGSYDNAMDFRVGNGARLVMGYQSVFSAESSIALEGGSALVLENGTSNPALNAAVTLEGNATIYGSLNYSGARAYGSISGAACLSLGMDQGHSNSWYLHSVLSDGAAGVLSVKSNSYVSLMSNNSYSGGTELIGACLSTGAVRALGSGSLKMTGGKLSLGTNLEVGSLSGTGGEIALNGHNLRVEQTADGSFAGTLSGGSLTKAGSGRLEWSGAGDNSLGSLEVTAGSLEISGSGQSSLGAVSVAAGARLQVASERSLLLQSPIQNQGYVQLDSRSISCTDLLSVTGDYEDALCQGSGNGFANRYWLVQNSGTGSSYVAATQVTVGERQYALQKGSEGVYFVDDSIYNVAKGTVVYGDAEANSATQEQVKSIALYQDSTLRLQESLREGVSMQVMGGSASVEMAEGTQLNHSLFSSSNGGSIVLKGSGEYALAEGSVALENDVKMGWAEVWDGSIRVSKAAFGSEGANKYSKINELCNGRSWVAIEQSSVDLQGSGAAESRLSANLRLEGSEALQLTGLQNGAGLKLAGDVKGSGELGVAAAADAAVSVALQGDVAGWDGTMKFGGDASYTVSYSGTESIAHELEIAQGAAVEMQLDKGSDMEVTGDWSRGEGSLNIRTAGEGCKSFAGKLQADELSLAAGRVEFRQTLEAASVELHRNAAAEKQTLITAKDAASSLRLQSVALDAGESLLEGLDSSARAENALIDLMEGSTLKIKDLYLADSSRITDAAASLQAENLYVQVSANNTTSPGTQQESLTLKSATGQGSATLSAAPVLQLVCSALDTVTVSGSSMTLDFSAYAPQLAAADASYISIIFSDGNTAASFDFSEGLQLRATLDGEHFAEAMLEEGTGTAQKLYFAYSALIVPEPSGTTLSLLALAALCARRRR